MSVFLWWLVNLSDIDGNVGLQNPVDYHLHWLATCINYLIQQEYEDSGLNMLEWIVFYLKKTIFNINISKQSKNI
jgi:hypothetical protein